MEKNDEEIEKWQLFAAAGAAIVVIGTGSVMMFSHPNTPDQAITKETQWCKRSRMDLSLLQSC